MKLRLLTLALLSCSPLHSNDEVSVRTIEGYTAYCRNHQWEVERDGQRYNVERYNVEKDLHHLPENIEDAQTMLDHFSVSAPQQSDGSLRLKAHVRGNGGGRRTAQVFYVAAKVLWYGTTAAASGLEISHIVNDHAGDIAIAIFSARAGIGISQRDEVLAGLPIHSSVAIFCASEGIKNVLSAYEIPTKFLLFSLFTASALGGGLETTAERIASTAWNVGMALPLP